MQTQTTNVGYTWDRQAGKTTQVLFETAVLVKNEEVDVYIQVDSEVMRERVKRYFAASLPEDRQQRIHLIHHTGEAVTLPHHVGQGDRCYIINLSTTRPFITRLP